jgi:hypothetical protein
MINYSKIKSLTKLQKCCQLKKRGGERKKINFSALASLVTAILKHCNVPYGGCFLFISGFEHEMKVDV